MYAVTGATGQLGSLVIERLLERVPADQVIAAVRRPEAASAFSAKGVVVREADYDRPETLGPAFAGVTKLLLISSSEIGKRGPQHRAAIDAAKAAGVGLIAYTSVVNADTSPLGLAAEHRDTESALVASGVPYVLLRNGWYSENHLAGVATALAQGALIGSAGNGRIASAARADYADAAVASLLADDATGRTYELAGDESWSLPELAAEIARQAGKAVVYQDLPEQAYAEALKQAGLPAPLAELLADSDVGASKGALENQSGDLSRLIGRPTTRIARSVADAL